jgi:LDH2 family malate/lactate/ureidoglycolate dehydrogenase
VRFVTADPARLRAATVQLLLAANVTPDAAEVVADVQLEADLRGMHSHGLRAIPMYLDRIAAGIVNPRPNVRVDGNVVHGDDGPGQYVARRAMSEAIERAKAGGTGVAVARRSNHLGAVGYYANMAAAADLIGFATTNGNVMLPPPGGSDPVVGNNPLAWAFPGGLEIDVATSVAAGGKVDLANAEGDPVPAGWLGPGGMAIPLGAPGAPHKGFGLALALEALAGVLGGARFGRQHAAEVEEGERPWRSTRRCSCRSRSSRPGWTRSRATSAPPEDVSPARPRGSASSERCARGCAFRPRSTDACASADQSCYCPSMSTTSSGSPNTSSGPLRSVGKTVFAIAAARRIFWRICSSAGRSRSG